MTPDHNIARGEHPLSSWRCQENDRRLDIGPMSAGDVGVPTDLQSSASRQIFNRRRPDHSPYLTTRPKGIRRDLGIL